MFSLVIANVPWLVTMPRPATWDPPGTHCLTAPTYKFFQCHGIKCMNFDFVSTFSIHRLTVVYHIWRETALICCCHLTSCQMFSCCMRENCPVSLIHQSITTRWVPVYSQWHALSNEPGDLDFVAFIEHKSVYTYIPMLSIVHPISRTLLSLILQQEFLLVIQPNHRNSPSSVTFHCQIINCYLH